MRVGGRVGRRRRSINRKGKKKRRKRKRKSERKKKMYIHKTKNKYIIKNKIKNMSERAQVRGKRVRMRSLSVDFLHG